MWKVVPFGYLQNKFHPGREHCRGIFMPISGNTFSEVMTLVKGISRQVIVVQSPEPKMFEQAIFILNDNAVGEGVTDDALLKEDVIKT